MKIFITVGTHPQPFDRLLEEIDSIAENKKYEIFAQTGCSSYKPKRFKSEKLLTPEKGLSIMKKSGIIITHAGAGSIIDACKAGKPLIVVPRLQKFNEHTNNHQLELAEAVEGIGKAICVKDIKKLEAAVKRAEKFKPKTREKNKIVERINDFLEGLE